MHFFCISSMNRREQQLAGKKHIRGHDAHLHDSLCAHTVSEYRLAHCAFMMPLLSPMRQTSGQRDPLLNSTNRKVDSAATVRQQITDQPFSLPSSRPDQWAKLHRFQCCRSLCGARPGGVVAEPSRAERPRC